MRAGTLGPLLFSILPLLVPPVLQAQARVGFYGGVSVGTFGGEDADDPASRVASQGGAFLAIPLSTVVSIRGGAAFVQKGAEESFEGVTARLALSYLEFPFLAQLTIPSQVAVSAHGLLGPVIGVEALCEFQVESQQGSAAADCDSPLFEGAFPTKSLDMSFLLGAGVTIAPRNPINGIIQITYEVGLSTIDEGTPAFDVKNRAFGLVFGISFGLGQ